MFKKELTEVRQQAGCLTSVNSFFLLLGTVSFPLVAFVLGKVFIWTFLLPLFFVSFLVYRKSNHSFMRSPSSPLLMRMPLGCASGPSCSMGL